MLGHVSPQLLEGLAFLGFLLFWVWTFWFSLAVQHFFVLFVRFVQLGLPAPLELPGSSVQLGLHACQVGHHHGLGTGVHHPGYQSGWLVYHPVQSVQLGLHPVLAARLGHLLVCTVVRLGCFSVYLTLLVLLGGYYYYLFGLTHTWMQPSL